MEQITKPVFITVASDKSKRLTGKNMIKVCGIPLIQYTIDFVKKLKRFFSFQYFIISDSVNIKQYAESIKINHLMIPEYTEKRDHAKGMEIMRWIHKNINASRYFMLPVTSPWRNQVQIAKIIHECLSDADIYSATTVYKTDRNNYKHNGELWYFRKEQLDEEDIIDGETHLFISDNDIDIDTIDDLKLFEKRVLNEN